jgi:predicted HTH transcriptional regulator
LIGLLGEVSLVENRGSWIRAMVSVMREVYLEPSTFEEHHDYFMVIFYNQALLYQESLTWLNRSSEFHSFHGNELAWHACTNTSK